MILPGLALIIHAHSRVLTKTSLAAGIAFRLILPGMGSIFSVALRSYQSGLFLKGLRFGEGFLSAMPNGVHLSVRRGGISLVTRRSAVLLLLAAFLCVCQYELCLFDV